MTDTDSPAPAPSPSRRWHLYEAELKEARRTRNHPDHTSRPDGPRP
ncbi:hypothetical protein [Streptomyces tendae]